MPSPSSPNSSSNLHRLKQGSCQPGPTPVPALGLWQPGDRAGWPPEGVMQTRAGGLLFLFFFFFCFVLFVLFCLFCSNAWLFISQAEANRRLLCEQFIS